VNALWPPEALAAATGGRMTVPFAAAGVSIDSRSLRPGDLFVALAGEHRDGHEFVAAALARGAAGALVSHRPADARADAPLLLVADTLAGLAGLGQFARTRSAARVVAITGSVGKTTTKEMLRRILEAVLGPGAVHAAPASYNNQWGVPLTLAELPPDAACAVIEIGMNHAGEIAPLAALARPDIAVVTGIEKTHIGLLGSLEAIADEKAALPAALGPGGVAILPRDTPFLPRLAARVPPSCRVITFGEAPLADLRLLAAERDAGATDVAAAVFGLPIRFALAAAGRHLALDSLAALAAAVSLGLGAETAGRALAGFAALPGRGARRPLRLAAGDAVLLDESYNASPAALRAALAVLAAEPGRRIAVLGDMLELGRMAADEHVDLAPEVADSADLVFACGPMMRRLFGCVPKRLQGAWRADAETLAPIVAAALAPGDAVLVKGSLGSRMRLVVEAIAARSVLPLEAG